MAYRVTFPDGKKFSGEYLSVQFKGGEGTTESDYLAERFANKGLTVEELEKPVEKMTVTELKAFAEAQGIDLGEAEKKPDVLKAIQDALAVQPE